LAPQTSADLLANVPGIKVQKSQFGGGSPVIRGMESNRVLLVVDGVRMNNAIYRKGHLQNAITVAPNMLDKTEIVFGPSSVIYGSDALGGVVHYYTKTPRIAEKKK
jgi:Outer membrane cobalamin receptor protein